MFVAMDAACLFARNGWSILVIRFLQGLGIGAEVPVASAYINEFIGAKTWPLFTLRGDFSDRYDVCWSCRLFSCSALRLESDVLIGLIPSALTVPLRWLMPESPRWLTAKGRHVQAEKVVAAFEKEALQRGMELPEPVINPAVVQKEPAGGVKNYFPASINHARLCYGDYG